MRARSISGLNSIVIGAIGLVVVIAAKHWESFRGTASSYLLLFADRHGLIKNPPPGGEAEARAPGLLSFTDETALQALLGYGVYLGAASILLAVLASFRREDSAHASAGLICGWLTLFMADYYLGMFALLVGAALVFVARRQRNA